MSSLSAISAQNPHCDAYLQAVVDNIASVPSESSTPEFKVIKAADAAVKTVLFLPLLDDTMIQAQAPPTSAQLQQSEALWLCVTGLSPADDQGAFTVVCDVVGGQQSSQAHIVQGQCGITLHDV
jgi:hypothetical protein